MTLPRYAVILAALIVHLASAAGALAQSAVEPSTSADEDARLHFELGRRAYARADYEMALSEFQTSLALSNRTELHYNLFLAYHELERDGEALRELRAYIATVTDEEARGHLEARARRIEASLEARRAGEAATEAEPTDAEPDSTLAIGEEVLVPVSNGPSGLTIAGAATLGASALALIAFGVMGGMALSERDALGARCAPFCSGEETQLGRDLALGADISLGAFAAIASVGALLLALGLVEGGAHESATPRVMVTAAPTHAVVTVTGSL